MTEQEAVEHAQEELAEARSDAADLISDAEASAIEEIADAKKDAKVMVDQAEDKLEARLDDFSEPSQESSSGPDGP